ncbi:MAG: NDP-sugar synthase [Firmicutes bacterium]|nr:NDP-sugar synthase [Bacillota bacterium]
MKALLLAGGLGTRLHPLTYNLPKPMVPVANRPWLEHLLGLLKRHNISEVICSLCYRPEIIMNYFGDGSAFGIRMQYVVEKTPLGTGGAIRFAEHLLDDTFLVFNADIVTDLDLTSVVNFHKQNKARVTIALTWVDDPTAYGAVEMDRNGRILKFIEKPSKDQITTNFVNAGVYVFEPDILERIPRGRPVSLEREVYPSLLDEGVPVYGYGSRFYWMDLGTHKRYLALHADIFQGKLNLEIQGKRNNAGTATGIATANDNPGGGAISLGDQRDQVIIGREAHVHPTSRIHGPVIIGDRCVVNAGAVVGPMTVLGPGVVVGEGTHVRNSVIWAGTRIGSRAHLDRVIVGENYTVEDGRELRSMAIAES